MVRASQARRTEVAAAAVLRADEALLAHVETLTAAPDTPTPLPGWDLGVLVAHLATVVGGLVESVDRVTVERALDQSEYLRHYDRAAAGIDERDRGLAARLGWSGVLGQWRVDSDRLRERLTAGQLPARVVGGRGPVRTVDLLASRVLELVVHADDLDRTVGAPRPPFPRSVTQLAVRTATEALGERYPGHTIEVRVPPYAAVQCGIPGDGPTHTRGTPPNVVETDALTFLRLATGRTRWADALAGGLVAASGERADLSRLLPLW